MSVGPRRRRAAGPHRVVFDTTVVVSALVFGGRNIARLRQAWQAGGCTPLVSAATAQQLARVLACPKFRLDAAAQQELLADYLPYTEVVRIADPPPQVPSCRDPFDVPFLHLAVAGRAQALVTGDGDLLALASRVSLAIVSVDAFIRSLAPP